MEQQEKVWQHLMWAGGSLVIHWQSLFMSKEETPAL